VPYRTLAWGRQRDDPCMSSSHRRNTVPMFASRRCGARTRDGDPCKSPAVSGKARCRMHGCARGFGAAGQPECSNARCLCARGQGSGIASASTRTRGCTKQSRRSLALTALPRRPGTSRFTLIDVARDRNSPACADMCHYQRCRRPARAGLKTTQQILRLAPVQGWIRVGGSSQVGGLLLTHYGPPV
jgi:hypothetical protein